MCVCVCVCGHSLYYLARFQHAGKVVAFGGHRLLLGTGVFINPLNTLDPFENRASSSALPSLADFPLMFCSVAHVEIVIRAQGLEANLHMSIFESVPSSLLIVIGFAIPAIKIDQLTRVHLQLNDEFVWSNNK